jgi:putative salt-induced outer membrane protein YdiY
MNIEKFLYKHIIKIAIVISIPLMLAFFTSKANATGQFDLGGKIDDGDFSILTSVDYSWQGKRFLNDVVFDYRFKDSDGKVKTNRGLIAFKQRYEFKPKQYAFGLVRYDYNEFRPMNSRRQINMGYGYKILNSEKIKLSNEIAIGVLNEEEFIIRNSLWFFYKVAPKIKFTNKFLYESANTPLIRNETSFDYLLTDKVKIGLKNVYVDETFSDNILSFNVGYAW